MCPHRYSTLVTQKWPRHSWSLLSWSWCSNRADGDEQRPRKFGSLLRNKVHTHRHTHTPGLGKPHTALPKSERTRSLPVFDTLNILTTEAFITTPRGLGYRALPLSRFSCNPSVKYPLQHPSGFLSNPQFQGCFFFLNLLRSSDAKKTPARFPGKFACSEL